MGSPVSEALTSKPLDRLQGGTRASSPEHAATPLVSVITVVRNARSELQRTVENVLAQRDAAIEQIVVDGASTDGTREYLQSVDGQIQCWISEPDRGIYDAMNKGIQLARGEWIHFLNAGDAYDDPRFWTELAPALSSAQGITLCPVATVDASGRLKEHRGRKILYGGMPYCHQGILFSRKLFESVGMFDLTYPICADYDWLIRFFRTPGAGDLEHCIKAGKHRVIYDTRGVSSTAYKRREREVRQIVRRHFGLSPQWLRCILFSYLRVFAKQLIGRS